MSASRLLNEQRLFVDEEEITIGSGTSNGKKKKKTPPEMNQPCPFRSKMNKLGFREGK